VLLIQEPLALDGRVVCEISKRHFFLGIKIFLQMGNLNHGYHEGGRLGLAKETQNAIS